MKLRIYAKIRDKNGDITAGQDLRSQFMKRRPADG